MALIDKASLLMVPSTYEAGKLYNVLPSGNRAPDSTDQNSGYDQTRADFDFDRGSNASATRIGSDGLIKKYRENLLTYSNTFSDSDWGKGSSLTLTSGQSGYDGTNNAWLLSKGSVQYPSLGQQVSNSGVKTLSVYAKANATSNLCLFVSSSPSNFYQDFDLSNGTLGAGSNGVIATNIDSVGDGWYRCSVVFNGVTTSADIFPDTISGANTGSIYIQDAQLESGLVASSYLDSTSVTGKAGVLVDLPRINYDANGENGSLLLEPSRANLIPESEFYGSGSGWSGISGVSITDNAIASPEGNQNASYITFTNSGSSTQFYRVVQTTGSKQVLSVFVKYISGSGTGFRLSKSSDINYGINLEFSNNGATLTGTAGTNVDSYKIEDYGNQWFRVSVVINWSSSALEYNLFRHSGTGTDVYAIWGAQVEAANYVSSYIPCMGTSETRAADSITSGTITAPLSGGYTAFIELETLSTSVYNQIQFRETAANYVLRIGNQVNVGAGSLIQSNTTGMNKFALQVTSGGAFELFKNGSSVGTGTGITHDIELIKTDLAGQDVKQIAVFNEALTDAECITLTTL